MSRRYIPKPRNICMTPDPPMPPHLTPDQQAAQTRLPTQALDGGEGKILTVTNHTLLPHHTPCTKAVTHKISTSGTADCKCAATGLVTASAPIVVHSHACCSSPGRCCRRISTERPGQQPAYTRNHLSAGRYRYHTCQCTTALTLYGNNAPATGVTRYTTGIRSNYINSS